jgi:hypothetical protein
MCYQISALVHIGCEAGWMCVIRVLLWYTLDMKLSRRVLSASVDVRQGTASYPGTHLI